MRKEPWQDQSPPSVGKEVILQATEEIGKKSIRRFAQAVGDPNPLYSDEGYARRTRHRGIVAPPTMIFELGYDLGEEIDEETGLQRGLQEYLGNPRSIQRIGNEYEILETVCPEDILTVKRRIIEVTEKEGKSGSWILITSEIVYHNQNGRLLGMNREKLACRYEGKGRCNTTR